MVTVKQIFGEAKMDEIEEVRGKLQDRNLSFISRKLGIPYRTLRDFAKGRIYSTSAHNFVKLQKYLGK